MTESDWTLVACALIFFVIGLGLGGTVTLFLSQRQIKRLAAESQERFWRALAEIGCVEMDEQV